MKTKAIKRFTWRHWALGLLAFAVGSFFPRYQEYRASGSVDPVDMAISALTFCVGVGVIAAVSWYGNRQEKGEKK